MDALRDFFKILSHNYVAKVALQIVQLDAFNLAINCVINATLSLDKLVLNQLQQIQPANNVVKIVIQLKTVTWTELENVIFVKMDLAWLLILPVSLVQLKNIGCITCKISGTSNTVTCSACDVGYLFVSSTPNYCVSCTDTFTLPNNAGTTTGFDTNAATCSITGT